VKASEVEVGMAADPRAATAREAQARRRRSSIQARNLVGLVCGPGARIEESARRRKSVEAGASVTLVVGAASGIGRVAAQRRAAEGRLVVAADVDEAGLEKTAAGHPRIHTRVLDVTDAAAVAAAVGDVEASLGPIERAYNAAAIQPTSFLLDQDVGEIGHVMAVNYLGVVHVSLAVLPHMLRRGRGSLVNFASIAGWVPNMHFGAYCASKFAVVAFTEVLHHETRGRGVHVCCVCPGQVDTPLRLQARSRPKIMELGPSPQSAESVIVAVEKAIAGRRLWVFAGWQTAIGWRLRRFLPALMWRIDHRAEGV
jgi:NAD(P)-dependent dehydrogenase (short-subunit alcohol dehydrogenase family)